MSDDEGGLLRRWSGPRTVANSLKLGAVGIAPLLIYIAVGPEDGNPIGLGLLAAFTVPVALTGVAVGLVKTVWERGSRRPSRDSVER